jgi:hypothetical protein
MSSGGLGPEDGRDGPEPRLAQWGRATDGGRVMQAGGNQLIFNLSNGVWLTVPAVVVAVLGLVLYLIVGRPSSASGLPSPKTTTPHARQAPRTASLTQPLTVTLAYDQHDVNNGQGSCMNWIFTRPLSALPVPDSAPDETWARQYGGVDSGVTNFKLAVQGVTATAVQLLDFRVVDVVRGPIPRGSDVISSDGCGPSPEAGFQIALGRNPPLITPVAGLDSGAAKKIPFPFVVSSTDIQQFQVQALDSGQQGVDLCNCDIKWRLALDWSYEGKVGTTVIDDNGQPFQTAFPTQSTSPVLWFADGSTWKRFA